MVLRLRGGGFVDNIKGEMSNFFLSNSNNEFSSSKDNDNSKVNINHMMHQQKKQTNMEKKEEEDEKGKNETLLDSFKYAKKRKINENKNELKNNNILTVPKKEEKKDLLSTFVIIEDNEFNDTKKDLPIDENEFNTKYLKREELHVNLIYFDSNMTNKENYIYFNDFKVDVVGGFHILMI